jgi:hypothetical protein
MSTTDHRESAQKRVENLIATLKAVEARDQVQALILECEALARAIGAFHMEAIRFRMFNVDRLLTRGGLALPGGVESAVADVRRDLEAAGFHTRSHQAPTS